MAGKFQFGQQKELDELTDRILNREKFSYDLNGDAFYNQYKDKFTQQGKMAMMDTMGQAAALTGGYGSSYAQQVGQQTYQGYLQNLNDVVPELYQLARDNYDREGDSLAQQYSLLSAQEEKEYGRHRDQVADEQYWSNLSYQREQDAKQQELAAAQLMAQKGDYSRLANFYGLSEEEAKKLAPQVKETGASMVKDAMDSVKGWWTSFGSKSGDKDETGGSFTTREEALAHLTANGVTARQIANHILTKEAWEGKKQFGDKTHDTYEEYLADAVAYALENKDDQYNADLWW